MAAASAHKSARQGSAVIRDTAAQDRALDPAPRRRRRLLLVLAGLALVGVAGAVSYPAVKRFAGAELAIPLERLRLAQVRRGEFVRDVAVRGKIVAAVSPTLFAPADGTVTLEVEAGQAVARGEVLARLDSPEISNRLEQEQATLQSLETGLTRQAIDKKKAELLNQQAIDMAEVRIRAAERELRRAEASWADRIISRQDYEKAVDDLATARLEFEHARQNARLASESMTFELQAMELERDRQRLVVDEYRRQVAQLVVLSPVEGMVGSLAVDQKAAVSRNRPLMTVVDLSALEVEVEVPQEYADDLGLDIPAEISMGGASWPGAVRAVSPEVQDNQVKGRVRFAGAAPGNLRQNQRVSVRIILESRSDALVVQRGPFLDSGSGRLAYVVQGDLATRRPITVGAASVGEVEILEGLEAGETIVISDLDQFEGVTSVLLN